MIIASAFGLILLLFSHWYVPAISAVSDTDLCQAPCRGFSYKAAASLGSFQVAIRRFASQTEVFAFR